MVTILGAGGAIGNELVKQLAARSEAIRLADMRNWFRVRQKRSPLICQTRTTL
jgi:FlaA1/EpsC-like NDP-sugar epimerase